MFYYSNADTQFDVALLDVVLFIVAIFNVALFQFSTI